MERIFWVTCPHCGQKYYVDYGLRFKKGLMLICPFCQRSFSIADALDIDDRWF